MDMDIFEFYNWVCGLEELHYICFYLGDEDSGTEYVCKSKREVTELLCNTDEVISMSRLYRKEYGVRIYEIKF